MNSDRLNGMPATAVAGVSKVLRDPARSAPRAPAMSLMSDALDSSDTKTTASGSDVQQAVNLLNHHFATMRSDIRFSIAHDVGMVVVSVVDAVSGNVLLQLPTEQALQTAREIQRGQSGHPLIQTMA